MITSSILSIYMFLLTSFYALQFQTTAGNTVNMNNFQGKKILLVNIATGSDKVSQLAELQQLQQTYADSVVVIAFPSNSFGKETRTDVAIKVFCEANYNTSFIIAAKAPVTGPIAQPVYNWLAKASENGDMDLPISGDFQKILIGGDGTIRGVFSPKMSPLDSNITQAILSVD